MPRNCGIHLGDQLLQPFERLGIQLCCPGRAQGEGTAWRRMQNLRVRLGCMGGSVVGFKQRRPLEDRALSD